MQLELAAVAAAESGLWPYKVETSWLSFCSCRQWLTICSGVNDFTTELLVRAVPLLVNHFSTISIAISSCTAPYLLAARNM